MMKFTHLMVTTTLTPRKATMLFVRELETMTFTVEPVVTASMEMLATTF